MRIRVLLLPVLLVWACGLRAEPPMTQLRIVVTTESGRPVDRAGVRVVYQEARNYIKLGKRTRTSWELRTNQEGEAKVPSCPQGRILIQVIAKGYQTYGQTFQVDTEEKNIEIKLSPPQAQYSAH
jgi:hypothetical protein